MLLLPRYVQMFEKFTLINIVGTFVVMKAAYWLQHACSCPCLSVRVFLHLFSNIKMAPNG
jgi:hypothetical protein